MLKKILIAHFNKNLDWVSEIKPDLDYEIYSTSHSDITGIPKNKITFLPKNKGMDANMYLNFIINNYKDLPDKILFVHHHYQDWSQDFNLPFIINNIKWDFSDYVNIGCRHCYGDLYKMGYEYIRDDYFRKIWFLFEKYLPFPQEHLFYYAGTQFLTDKKLILQYPESFWRNLLEWLMKTEIECQMSGRIFEYLWHYILTKNPIDMQFNNTDIYNI